MAYQLHQVPARKYWQNSTISGTSNFIKAIKSGDIESRLQQPKQSNPFEEFIDRFVSYLPWSLLGLLALIGGTFFLFLPSGDTVIRPPAPIPMVPNDDIKGLGKESASVKKDQ